MPEDYLNCYSSITQHYNYTKINGVNYLALTQSKTSKYLRFFFECHQ